MGILRISATGLTFSAKVCTRPTHAAATALVEPRVKVYVRFRATWLHVLDPTEHGSQIAGYHVPVYASGTVESGGNRPIQRAYPRAMVRSRTQIIRHERGPGMVNVQIHRILRLASKETIPSLLALHILVY